MPRGPGDGGGAPYTVLLGVVSIYTFSKETFDPNRTFPKHLTGHCNPPPDPCPSRPLFLFYFSPIARDQRTPGAFRLLVWVLVTVPRWPREVGVLGRAPRSAHTSRGLADDLTRVREGAACQLRSLAYGVLPGAPQPGRAPEGPILHSLPTLLGLWSVGLGV